MIKTLKIGDQSVRINNNIGWALEFQNQFGYDIIPVIMPAISGALNLIFSLIGDAEKVTVHDVARALDGEKISDVLIELSGIRFTDFINIFWSLAKAEDETIPEPREWVKQFDVFPLDVVFPEVMKVVVKGLVSTKNLKRLQKMAKDLQAEASDLTKSSSQEPNAG